MRADKNAVITGEVLYRMTYTRTVVREILRFRPPAPMVPQVISRFAVCSRRLATRACL